MAATSAGTMHIFIVFRCIAHGSTVSCWLSVSWSVESAVFPTLLHECWWCCLQYGTSEGKQVGMRTPKKKGQMIHISLWEPTLVAVVLL